MTPDLEQCTALEDIAVLVRCLGDALMAGDERGGWRRPVQVRRDPAVEERTCDRSVVHGEFVAEGLLSGVLAMMLDYDCGKL